MLYCTAVKMHYSRLAGELSSWLMRHVGWLAFDAGLHKDDNKAIYRDLQGFGDGLVVHWRLHRLQLTGACCRVGGELSSRSVRHVGAGLNLTVACTTDGAVWQMGTTTASTKGYSAPWEGCSNPTQVLPGCSLICCASVNTCCRGPLLQGGGLVEAPQLQYCASHGWARAGLGMALSQRDLLCCAVPRRVLTCRACIVLSAAGACSHRR